MVTKTKTKTVCTIIGQNDKKKDWLHNNRSPPPPVLQRPPIARKLPFTLADARRSKVRCGEKEFEDGKCRVAFS